jgi:hypothetical protein
VISQFTGATVRAILMVILIATPSILVPGTSADTAQIVAFVSIFAAALTLFEYASTYPGLIEFRDAPPFNRIRFISLFLTVFLLSVVVRGQTQPTVLTEFVTATGVLIGQAIDFPYSPVRLILMMPESIPAEKTELLRTAAGMAYLISLVSLAVFLVVLRLMGWPSRTGAFNVWVNMPTFDPTAGGDVVDRLERDARINIVLGFLLPFITPMVVKAASAIFGAVSLANDQTLIWTVAAWAFLPASLFMRGIAMGRIAAMITAQRRKNEIAAGESGLAHA